MFSKAIKILKNFKPIIAATLLTTTCYGIKKIKFDQPKFQTQQISQQHLSPNAHPNQAQKKILTKTVCKSSQIPQGDIFITQIEQQPSSSSASASASPAPLTYKVLITRFNGKLYSVLAHCSYIEPLSTETFYTNTLQNSIVFNDKLYCPHHGCAFDVKTGTVQYGPALDNLSRIFVEEDAGDVKISYPARIPTSIMPKFQLRDLNDLKKVVIIGGDHHATIGALHGLKLYEYSGDITIVERDEDGISYPYRHDLMHKHLLNLNKDKTKPFKIYKPQQIEKQLEQKIYKNLQFYQQIFYQALRINFMFTSQRYRIINKRFFPYIKFANETKLQFDGLIFTTGFTPKFPIISDITTQYLPIQEQMQFLTQQQLNKPFFPPNVFAPYYNRKQHIRLNQFLNRGDVRKMAVFGMNLESLEFVEAVKREFPDIQVKVFDVNKENSLTQVVGPNIMNQILKQFTKNKVEFYIKIAQIPTFQNTMALKNPKSLPLLSSIPFLSPSPSKSPNNSISIQLDKSTTILTDCIVLFPNNTLANTQNIKSAKFVDIDYNKNNNRIVTDQNCRTDTLRMFAAGSCSTMEYYFTRSRMEMINPNWAYEQGFAAAVNLGAHNVPFNYIPFQTHSYFGKKLLYTGVKQPFDQMFIMGNPSSWDFIAFYALNNEIHAISASPSRSLELLLFRQSFRLNCTPNLSSLASGQWSASLLYKLIRKLNKSGCYKQLIKTIDPIDNMHQIVWMDREKGSFVANQRDDQVEYDQRGYVQEKN